MRLQDDIDFTTLTWVKGELDETLKQARHALEAFVEDPTDISQMRFCATYLHQVQGTLRMVELYGAAMVTEEMERLATLLTGDRIGDRDEAYTVLMRGIVQLPDYLERLQSGHKDIPIVLLPLLNDLRAIRGEKGLPESALFSPDLSRPLPGSAKGPEAPLAPAALAEQAERLRMAFQVSLLKWFKNEDPATHVARLAMACDRLVSLVAQDDARRLFWVSGGLLAALRENAFDPPAPLKQAIGKIEREIKRLVDGGEAAFRLDPPRELTRTLLYFAAHAPTQHGRIAELRQTFELEKLLPTEEELRHAQGSISGHNRALLDTVSAAIKEDLMRVKDALDLYMRTQSEDYASLAVQGEVLARVADTLGMLGLGVPRGVVLEQRQTLDAVAAGKRKADEAALLDVAGALLYVESSLDDQVAHLGATGGGRDASHADSRKVLDALIKEAQSNFAQAKQSFVAFVESNWDHAQLQDVPRLLDEVGGALRILELDEPPRYLTAIGKFTETELLGRHRVPNGQQLDTLADALASLEYYLEALREHRAGREKILDVARQRLEALGYWPIPEAGAESVLAEVPTAPVHEALAAVSSAPVARAETAPEVPASELQVERATVAGELPEALVTSIVEPVPAAAELLPETAGGVGVESPVAAEAEPEAPAPAVPAAPAAVATFPAMAETTLGFEGASDEIDEEIREVFIEEVQEEIDNLASLFPGWRANPEHIELIKPIRRVFHTLKGSGRLVGALTLGEFSWKIENMLNRVLDQTVRPDAAVVEVIAVAQEALPDLLEALKGEGRVRTHLEGLKQMADRIAGGDLVSAAQVRAAAYPSAVAAVDTTTPAPAALQPEAIEEASVDLAAESASAPVSEAVPEPATEALASIEPAIAAESFEAAPVEAAPNEVPIAEAAGSIEAIEAEAVAGAIDVAATGPGADDHALDAEHAVLEAELAAAMAAFTPEAPLHGTAEASHVEVAVEAKAEAEGDVEALRATGSAFEIDSVLFDILTAEVAGHLETVDEFLAGSREHPQPVSDALLRAVHTMSGAFAMTEVPHITDVVGPLEGFIKRSIAHRHTPARAALELLEEAAGAIRTLMRALSAQPSFAPRFEALAERLLALRDTLPETTGPLLPMHEDEEVEASGHEAPATASAVVSAIEAPAEEAAVALEADGFAGFESAAEVVEPIIEEIALATTLETTAPAAGTETIEVEADAEGIDADAGLLLEPALEEGATAAVTDEAEAFAAIEVAAAGSAEPELPAEAGEWHVELADTAPAGEEPWSSESIALEAPLPASEPARAIEEQRAGADDDSFEFEETSFDDLAAEGVEAEAQGLQQVELTETPGFELVEVEFDTELTPDELTTPVGSGVVGTEVHPEEDHEAASLVALLLAEVPATTVSDANQAEAVEAEAVGAEAVEAEAVEAEVAEAEAVEAEAVEAEVAEAEAVEAEAVEAEAVEAEAVEAEAVEAEAVEAEAVEAEAVEAEAVEAEAAEAEAVEAEAVEAEAVEAEAVEAEAVEAEVVEAEAASAAAGAAAEARGMAALAGADPDPDAPLQLPDMDEELLDIFLEEGVDILDHSDGMLARLREEPGDRELIVGLQRDLHTLKGGARMAGLMPIGDLGHAAESLLEAVADGRRELGSAGMEVLERVFDRLHNMVTRVGERRALAMPATLLGLVDSLVRGEAIQLPQATSEAAAPLPAQAAAPESTAPAAPRPVVGEAAVVARPTALDATEEEEHGVRAPQEQIRIRADLLDRLVNYAGEVAIYRARLEQQIGAFRGGLVEMEATTSRLREQLRRLEIETEAQIIARYQREDDSGTQNFDPLELDRFSTLQQLSRGLSESAADLTNLQGTLDDLTRQYETLLLQQSRVSSELQEGLMRTRMVPFDALVPRLRRILRQTASELGKKAQLKVEGAQGEMDRNVLDRMTAPLEHMLRNAIAHGMETPAEREKAGKPAEGSVRIQVAREASEVVIRVSDDGRGMDREAIRRKAIERGLMAPDAQLSDRELFGFVLESGFSTAASVSKIAGRGVGMDVVHSEIKQLGGSLYIDSQVGRGTEFVIRLPFTLAVTQAVFVKLGETAYAIPITSVQGVARIAPADLEAQVASGDPQFEYAGEKYAIHDLGRLLGHAPVRAAESLQVPLLLARSGDLRAAISIDSVIGSKEIVVKPTGPQINSIPGIFGATVMGDGSVVVILDVAPLVRRATALRAVGEAVREAEVVEQRKVPLVMVVDDSITMRKVSSRVLERGGYEVLTAKDGVDAIEKMQERVPDAMLLDIEMPRMDGYELATHMRNDIRLRNVPIIMITSRTGEKHRQRAFEIGVDRYLGKPYQEPELMRNVQEVLKVGRGGAA